MSAKVKKAPPLEKELTLGYCSGNGGSIQPFDRTFNYAVDVAKNGFAHVDAVILWGGTDIHPSFYGQKPHRTSGASVHISERDLFERNVVKYCVAHQIPLIGVCRGAQLLCALAGGSLAQDVRGHTMTHSVNSHDFGTFKVTSSHHQMMNPFTNKVPHVMLAWSDPHLSNRYEEEEEHKNNTELMQNHEPEIVYFPGINGLAIQGHPEWSINSQFADICNTLVLSYLFNYTEKEQDSVNAEAC